MTLLNHEFNDYKLTILTSLEDIEIIEKRWKDLNRFDNTLNVYTNPNFFKTQFPYRSPNRTPFIVIFNKEGIDTSIVIGKSIKKRMPIKVGYLKTYTRELLCLEIEIGGIIVNQKTSKDVIIYYFQSLLSNSKFDLIEFQHFSEQNVFWDKLNKKSISNKVIIHKGVESIANISNEENDEEIILHKAKTLRNFRRADKKINNELVDINIKTYADFKDLKEFILKCEEISKNSYHDSLGIGIKDDKYWYNLISNLIKYNYFLGFILYSGEKPIAYNFGVLYDNYFFGYNMSFDLSYRKLMPGSFLIRQIIKILITKGVNYYHFGYGDSEYKKIFSNIRLNEASFYFYGNSFKVNLNYYFVFVSNKLNEFLIDFLEKVGIIKQIKKIWRNKIS